VLGLSGPAGAASVFSVSAAVGSACSVSTGSVGVGSAFSVSAWSVSVAAGSAISASTFPVPDRIDAIINSMSLMKRDHPKVIGSS
jgi:hypothetical protein